MPKISFTHGLIFFWKIHFETIQFWIQENPIKKKNVFKKEIGQSLIQKISFTHGLKIFWANPFWNNPILNTGKSNQKEKLLFKNINVYSLIHKHPLLMALIQLWKIHFGTILFAKMQNRIWKKNKAFEKHTCSQLDPTKTLAHSHNRIFWISMLGQTGPGSLQGTLAWDTPRPGARPW